MTDVYRTVAIVPEEPKPERKPRWRVIEKRRGYSFEKFRIQRRGFLGLWWQKGYSSSLAEAKAIARLMIDSEEKGIPPDVVWTDLDR